MTGLSLERGGTQRAAGVGTTPGVAWLSTPRAELWAAILAGVALLAGAVLSRVGSEGGWVWGAGQGLVWVSLGIGLFFGGRAALESLRTLKFDIDVLMFLGAVLAAYIGAPAEGALLLFLFTLSGALEDLALARTTRAVEALSKLMPTRAQRWRDGAWEDVAPEALVPGDRVRVLPGELIPTDARVAAGETSINQSSLTGESMPRDVGEGDEVYAGTVNVGNPVEVVVTRAARESSLQKILTLVTEAQRTREPIQRVIDRISQPYAVGVAVASVVIVLAWNLVLGFPWTAGPEGGVGAIYTGITFLIVASPCALIIATPTATLAAISRAARSGVLFKGGQAIERLARVRAVAFDKTGTLTIGRPRVMQVHPVGWSSGREMLSVAAGLEDHSTHPIATAVLEVAQARGVEKAPAAEVRYVAGRGVAGLVDGHEARLGSLAFTRELIPVCLRGRVEDLLEVVQGRGQMAVVCAWNEQAAVIILTDAPRPGAECLAERLHELGVRPVVMLTGDNRATARRVAEALGLDEFHAELLPQDKVAHVERLRASGLRGGVGVIGDGVNDAPALATADVSIAIGSIGSDAALESADIVMLSDDLLSVPRGVALARRARLIVKVNLVIALGLMALMAGLTLGATLVGGWQLPLWIGVLGHEGGTLLVVANSLTLLVFRGDANCTCDKKAHHRQASEGAGVPGAQAPGGTPGPREVSPAV